MELIIARHCVPSDPVTGLSPLQQALVDAPQRVRIADAPTGAGKSYAFQWAMAKREQRILFIVPTRRLAQNLAASLAADLVRNEGWPAATAEAKVTIWSSDQTTQLREQGVTRIGGYRLRQLQALDDTREGGEMIVAIPEVVSHLLLQRRMEEGQAATGIFDILTWFDHIVFDEFHTIDARGFGLAALCARLASVSNPDSSRFGRARVSLLSATPLDVRPVFERLGINNADIAELHETVGPEGRALHGNVTLVFDEAPSLAELLAAHRAAVADRVRAGEQVVMIYNRLGDLVRELPHVVGVFRAINLSPDRVLVINSIADSGPARTITGGCHAGRWRNPDDYDVLIATASVEIGVTFRNANLMFMEPGFQPMNFLQRYGRAARRGQEGQVWVRWDRDLENRNPWFRQLLSWARDLEEPQADIGELSEVLSRATREQFRDRGEAEPRYYGRLSNRAVYTAALYWNALLRHPSNQGPRRDHLLHHKPHSAGLIYSLLRNVRQMEQDRQFGECAKRWCERFEAQVYTLRDIGERLRVVEENGAAVEADVVWLQRETTILDCFPLQFGANGREEVRISGNLDDYLREQRERVRRMVTVYFPHTDQTARLAVGDELVETWCRNLKGQQGPEGVAWDDYPEAMGAAEKLVRLTGLVPSDDDSLSLAACSGVL